jgi:TonB family protein
MKTEPNDEMKSWGISIFVHALLLFITMFWVVASNKHKTPEVIELTIAEVGEAPVIIRSAIQSIPHRAATSTAASTSQARQARVREQRAPAQDQTQSQSGAASVRVPPRQQRGMEETSLPDFGAGSSTRTTASDPGAASIGRRDSRENDLPSSGNRDAGTYGVEGDQNSPITTDPGELSGTPATASNIDWGNGPSRNRIAGAMPVFPPGVNREAKIKVRFTVRPDGSVRGITFLQKGEPTFENAVLRAMRTWKFTALPVDMSQVDQNAIATFNFQLR